MSCARPLLVPLLLALSAASCSGRLGYRVDEELSGGEALPEDITAVRFLVEDGTLTVLPSREREVTWEGMCRKASDSPEQLELLEGVPVTFAAARDPDSPGTLVFRAPAVPAGAEPEQNVIAVQAVLRLPPTVAVEIRATHRGHLAVQDWRAPVHVETAHGDLKVKDVRGPAVLRTAQGNTIVDGHRGDLDVRATNGRMVLWIQELGETRLHTSFGDIQCQIPSNVAFRLDARTQRGKVTSGFPIAVRRTANYSAAMEGEVGRGGPAIVMRTGSGNLSLGIADS